MIVQILLFLAAIYLAFGLLFTIPFIIKGIATIDEGARSSDIGFRIIIIPGVMIFWPFLLKKWIKAKSASHDQAA